ncbi:glycosyltransferase 61 family protein [Grimontia sp. SpTr1]|uniref:glycosyltransferase family 61 protein n=1 Tax=Grimontia sp. SpTr1 TaxID=2995319 RepID=UPI00248BA754|nr:glycosyltransferase 61 family protein [Grimontia sp. SpTr1]
MKLEASGGRFTFKSERVLESFVYLLKDVVVDNDFFTYSDTDMVFFEGSTNEYFSDNVWISKRLKLHRDLGFPSSKCTLISDELVHYINESPVEVCEEDNYFFIYDYPWGENYQHWLITSLSRLALFIELKASYPNIKLLHHRDSKSFKREALLLFGIENSDIVDHSGSVRYKNIILPSFPSCCGLEVSKSALRMFNHISESTPKEKNDSSHKIYLARDDSNGKRPLSNRKELDTLLKEKGFEKVYLEELSFENKVRLFSTAEVVIGDFSAGWGHVVFCKPGVKLLLLEHDIFKFDAFYRGISNSIGATFESFSSLSLTRKIYLYILKLKWINAKTVDKSANSIPWKVDVGRLEKLL